MRRVRSFVVAIRDSPSLTTGLPDLPKSERDKVAKNSAPLGVAGFGWLATLSFVRAYKGRLTSKAAIK